MRNLGKWFGIVLAVSVGVLSFAGCGAGNAPSGTNTTASSQNAASSQDATGSEEKKEDSKLLSGKHHVEITVKDKGTIAVELDADEAPISVTNFVNLANEGFYDGLTFHRVIEGFMMQGGDPLGNGTGGASMKIKGEFSANGIRNNISHLRGVISMARSTPYNSASSQFFIMHEDNTGLDGQYAAFGKVTSGMEVVDDVCTTTPVQDSNGTVAAEDQPVIEKIVVID